MNFRDGFYVVNKVPATKSGQDANFSIFGGWHLFPDAFPHTPIPTTQSNRLLTGERQVDGAWIYGPPGRAWLTTRLAQSWGAASGWIKKWGKRHPWRDACSRVH